MAARASTGVLLRGFASARAGGGGELAWGRPRARADVLSIGVSNLQDGERAVPQPFLKASAKAATAEADVFQRFYLGVGAKPVPPEGRPRIVLDAADPNRAVEKIKMWEQAIGQSRARRAAAMPTVA